MGTTYHIQYNSDMQEDLSDEIHHLLKEFNQSVSTYIPESAISRFNRSNRGIVVDSFMKKVFLKSREINELTKGAFDPTVMPLVNAWGFGFENYSHVDSQMIDSLKQFVGMDKVFLKDDSLIKVMPGVMLDFSAIAKGYGVDLIANLLENHHIHNYMVEIGGEVRVKGKNSRGNLWRVGIEKPLEGEREIDKVLEITNIAVATSGNYRNFYYKNGKRYAHTIDPSTGYPVQHSVLSATVLALDCMTADALATAIMVLGKNNAMYLDSLDSVSLFLILDNHGKYDYYISSEISNKIKDFEHSPDG